MEFVGNGVSSPEVLSKVNPGYSEDARQNKISGDVLVYLEVDQDGLPQHVRVIRGVGHGLDEKAVEAVKQYKFKPATKDGRPVKVAMNIKVNFQIF
jgi:protein TonB